MLLQECETVFNESTQNNNNNKKIVDLDQITGRNLITGQTITLGGYMERIMGQKPPPQIQKPTQSSQTKKLIGKIVKIERQKPKNKEMSRDTFDYITRMLVGLMTMENVAKKWCEKSLKIKVVEKSFTEKYKTISRLCGFMATIENDLNNWRFFPIRQIGNDFKSVEIEGFDNSHYVENIYLESTSFTLYINTEVNGRRSTRINLTPNCKNNNNNKQYKCEICEKVFMDGLSLEKHRALHCGVCGKSFELRVHLKRHLAQHVSTKRSLFSSQYFVVTS